MCVQEKTVSRAKKKSSRSKLKNKIEKPHQYVMKIRAADQKIDRIYTTETPIVQKLKNDFPQDWETILAASICWTSLLSDISFQQSSKRLIIRFFNRLVSNFAVVVEELASIGHALERGLKWGYRRSVMKDDLSVLLRKTPVFQTYRLFYETSDPKIFRVLITFFTFGKKVKLIDTQHLDTSALREWKETEDRLRHYEPPDWICNIKSMFEVLISEWSNPVFCPKHGPGGVANDKIGRSIRSKNSVLNLSENSLYQQESWYGDLGKEACIANYARNQKKYNGKNRTSAKLIFVPKTLKSRRSIAMEPVQKQFEQQGLASWLVREMNDSYVKTFIDLRNQETSQGAVLDGFGRSTIDLRGASDSVSIKNVKQCTPYKILKYLISTRSKLIELPDGTEVELQKFAPMGSSTNFPYQSLFYLTVVLTVTYARFNGMDYTDTNLSKAIRADFHTLGIERFFTTFLSKSYEKNSERSRFVSPIVYGDDIICDRRISRFVIEALQLLSFQVNEEKSFLRGPFKESCGMRALAGHDVSPLNWPRQLGGIDSEEGLTAQQLASFIELANAAYDWKFKNLRRAIIQFLFKVHIKGVEKVNSLNPLVFTTDRSASLAVYTSVVANGGKYTESTNIYWEKGICFWDPGARKLNTHLLKTHPYQTFKGSCSKATDYQKSYCYGMVLRPLGKEYRNVREDPYYYTVWSSGNKREQEIASAYDNHDNTMYGVVIGQDLYHVRKRDAAELRGNNLPTSYGSHKRRMSPFWRDPEGASAPKYQPENCSVILDWTPCI